MIATLTGKVAEKLLDGIVLDVSGVGYGLLVSSEDYGSLSTGDLAKLYVYEHIRENSYDLYGFTSLDTKQLFELLLSVTGVGPKVALGVLNTGPANSVRAAIAGGGVKAIQQASGVGKRVAERIVVELKDKVGLTGVDLAATGLLSADATLMQDEAVEALVALGYTVADAAAVLSPIDKTIPTEDRIKQALRQKG
jgi:Holliday junction DNA helicase RuvA